MKKETSVFLMSLAFQLVLLSAYSFLIVGLTQLY